MYTLRTFPICRAIREQARFAGLCVAHFSIVRLNCSEAELNCSSRAAFVIVLICDICE
jgi:hypothetical protein